MCFGAHVVSLSLWWDPTGRVSWGPRLLLPAAAPTIVIALSALRMTEVGRGRLRPSLALPLAVVSIVVLVPTLGAAFGSGKSQSSMLYATWSHRPNCTPDRARPGTKLYESCERTEDWRLVGMPLVESVPRGLWGQEGHWVALASASIAVILALRRGRRVDDKTYESDSRTLDGRRRVKELASTSSHLQKSAAI